MFRHSSLFPALAIILGLGTPVLGQAQQPEQQPCFEPRADQQADLDSRIAACMRVIGDNALSPDVRAAAHLRRGLAYVQKAAQSKQKDDINRALADVSESLRLVPDNPAQKDIHQLRASLYFHSGDLDRALADYTALIRLDANSANAYAYRGFVFATKGEHERAIADYTEAIRLGPKIAASYTQRAWSYLQVGKAVEGVLDADRALELDPNDAAAYGTRGLLYRSLGKTTDAIADLRKSLSLDPSNEAIREELQRTEQVAAAAVPPKPAPTTPSQPAASVAPTPPPAPKAPKAAMPNQPTSSRAASSLSSAEELALKPKDTFKECEDCPEMVVVPAGEFMMGSNEGEADEKSVRKVTINRPFAVSLFESTFAEWDACVSDGGCKHKPEDKGWGRANRPVINVSWDDITKEYLPWLNRKTGKQYRLLTEAEWEYAARAGSSTKYTWGDDVGQARANCDGCGSQWDNKQTAPVGSFQPNAFGLYDMHGNVWEWVADCYKGSYVNAVADGTAVPEAQECARVRRGGSWYNKPKNIRAALRGSNPSALRRDIYGFRLARPLAP